MKIPTQVSAKIPWSERAAVLLPLGAAAMAAVGLGQVADGVALATLVLWMRSLARRLGTPERTTSIAPMHGPLRTGWADAVAVAGLLAVATLAVRRLLSLEPIIYWDYLGFGMSWRDGFHVWSWRGLGRPSPPDTYATFLYPIAVWSRSLATNLVLWLPPYGMVASMFALCRGIGVAPVAAMAASIVYMGSAAVHTRYLQGHTGMLLGYATFPLVLLHLVRVLDAPTSQVRIRHALWLAMFAALTSLHQLHFLPIVVLLVLSVFTVACASPSLRDRAFRALPWLLGSAVIVVCILAPQLYALFTVVGPQAAARAISSGHVEALSQRTSMVNLLRLIGEPAAGMMDQIGYYIASPGPLLAFGVTVAAGLAIVQLKGAYEPLVIALGVGTSVSLILATGTTYLPPVYLWATAHVPFFGLYRESSKFLSLPALTMPVLLGIWLGCRNQWNGRLAALAAIASVTVMSIGAGDFGVLAVHRIPRLSREYREVGRWIDSRQGLFRVLVIPYDDVTYRTWPQVSQRPAVGLDLPGLLYSTPGGYHSILRIFGALRRGDRDALMVSLGRAGVRYVVVAARPPYDPALITSPVGRIDGQSASRVLQSMGLKQVMRLAEFAVYETSEAFGLIQVFDDAASSSAEPCEAGDGSGDGKGLQAVRGQAVHLTFANAVARVVDPSEVPHVLSRTWIAGDALEFFSGGFYADGERTLGGTYAVTRGRAVLSVPVRVPDHGTFELWVRFASAPPGRTLAARFGDSESRVRGRPLPGFTWARAHKGELQAGANSLELRGEGDLLAIDAVALLPSAGSGVLPVLCTSTAVDAVHQGVIRVAAVSPSKVVLVAPPDFRGLMGIGQAHESGWIAVQSGGSLPIRRMGGETWAASAKGSSPVSFYFSPQRVVGNLLGLQVATGAIILTVAAGLSMLARIKRG